MRNLRIGTFSRKARVASAMVPPPAPERELAEDAGQFAAILASIADGLMVTDAQGRLLHLNPAYQAILGLDHEPKGVTLPNLQRVAGHAVLDARNRPITEAARPGNRILQGEVLTGTGRVDLVLRTLNGRERRVSVSGAPVRDEAGNVLGAVQVLRDVTEQHRLEEHTREALQALLAMSEALLHVREAPNDTSATSALAPHRQRDPDLSEAARRLAELTCRILACRTVSIVAVEPETALIHPVTVVDLSPTREAQWWASWDRLQHLSEHFDPSTAAALQAGELVAGAHMRLPMRRGQRRSPVDTALLAPMRLGDTLVGLLSIDTGGRGDHDCEPSPHWQALVRAAARLGALLLDRERLLRERTAALASEMALRETNEQMDAFVAIASHELKTPLTSLMLSLCLIEQHIQELLPHVGNALGGANQDREPLLRNVVVAEQQVERLDRLVNDLLDASRVRAGKLELRREPVDLAVIVREVVQEQRQLAPARVLQLQVPSALRGLVLADSVRIGQVVTNYLTNALKYSPADRPVAIGIAVDDRQVRVWVRDEGPGLSPEEQEQIWERFHRARGIVVQSGSGIGLGLGLYICRTIIERHHGQVGVDSAPGKGSTFWFTLPLARREADA